MIPNIASLGAATAVISLRAWIQSLEDAQSSIRREIKAFNAAIEEYERQINIALQSGLAEEYYEALLERHQSVKKKIAETQDELQHLTNQLENITELVNNLLLKAKG